MALSNLALLLLKLETTYGTDASPSNAQAADAVVLRNAEWMPIEGQQAERPRIAPYHGNRGKPGVHSLSQRLTGEVPLCGSGAAGTAAPWGKLLRLCGMAEVLTASTKAEYAPVSSGFESASGYWYIDGTLHKGLGKRGSFSINMRANEEPSIGLEYTSLYADPTAVALPTPTFSAWSEGEIVRNGTTTLSIGGNSYSMQSFRYTHGGQVVVRDKPGTYAVRLTDRAPTAELVIDAPDGLSPANFMALAKAETELPIILTHGTVAGKIIEVRLPQARLLPGIRYGSDNGILQLTLPIMPRPTLAGNNELLITAK